MDKCLPDKNEAVGAGSAITGMLSLTPTAGVFEVPEVDPVNEEVATNPSGRAMKTGSVGVSESSTDLTPDDASGMNVVVVVVVTDETKDRLLIAFSMVRCRSSAFKC